MKVKEKFEKTRQVKSNDKSKKYILQGEKNVRYYDRILSKLSERQQKQKYFNIILWFNIIL